MRFCTLNVRSRYGTGSLTEATRELARYKLHLVGVQEVRWDKGSTVRAKDCNFFCEQGNEKSSIGDTIFLHHRSVSS
jgi:hypothetical protein